MFEEHIFLKQHWEILIYSIVTLSFHPQAEVTGREG